MANFKDRLRELIKEKNKTQKDVAKEIAEHSNIELSPQTLSYYVNGREPNYELLKALAKYFDVSVDYLIGYSDAKKAENEKLIADLGIKDDAIRIIQSLRTQSVSITDPESYVLKNDERQLLDVFNEFVSDNYFMAFLTALKISTHPTVDDIIPNNSPFQIKTTYTNISKAETYAFINDKIMKTILDNVIDSIKDNIKQHSK